MAGDSVKPGMSDGTVKGVARRIAGLERIMMGMSKQRLIADTPTGRNEFQVLAMRGRPDDDATGSDTDGAFYGMYVKTGEEDAGDTFLQGGTVSGGNGGTVTIEDFKVKEDDTGTVHPAGTKLYLQVSCEATIADGLMLPGCKVLSASLSTTTGSLPSNHTFTVSAGTGNLYAEIGRWNEIEFMPSAPGNVLASGCIGNFNLSRA